MAKAGALQQQQQQPALPVPISKPDLTLPAPVQDPMVAELDALKAKLAAREPLLLPRAA